MAANAMGESSTTITRMCFFERNFLSFNELARMKVVQRNGNDGEEKFCRFPRGKAVDADRRYSLVTIILFRIA
jgi:hypothetical protein